MAEPKVVPRGPGQAEVNGPIDNPRQPNDPGLYKDPASGAELEVTMHAGADALVRLGWKRIGDISPKTPASPERNSLGDREVALQQQAQQAAPSRQPAKPDSSQEGDLPENPGPLPDTTDDPDVVEEQQDNAAGHKVEGENDTPGVPAGDPKDLQKESKAAKDSKSAKK
jgi:hypothetical protein